MATLAQSRVRIPIRWKLIGAVVAPMVVIFGSMMLYDYARLRNLASAQTRLRLSERAMLYADRFDGAFESIAQVARSTASMLTEGPMPDERQLDAIVRADIGQDPLIYGSCIAFQPDAFRPGLRLFAPYACRDGDGLRTMDIGRDGYDYTDGRWEWYTAVQKSHEARWSEPYFDTGAGAAPMVTFSAPFFDGDTFRGVVTVDVRLEDLRRSVAVTGADVGAGHHDEPAFALRAFGGGDFGILSRTGAFVFHPNPDFLIRQSVFTLAKAHGSDALEQLGRRLVAGDRGVDELPASSFGEPAFAAFAPIRSTGWSFIAVMAVREAMAPVYAQLTRRAIFILAGGGLIALVAYLAGMWLVRPVRRLAAAVGRLGGGDLDARAVGVESRDEIGDLARAFNTMTVQLKEHVEALTRETAAREQVESELRVARAIQKSLLPSTFPPFPGHTEFMLHAINAPARRVAGDFFDFFLAPDGTLAFVIADVSGKGVPAAMFMAVARTLLRDLAARIQSPGELLARANKQLLESNNEGMFVTLFFGRYDPATGRVRYANAGHPPPIVVRPDGSTRPFGESTGTILGAIDGAAYEDREESLQPGESVVLYTDGVPEAKRPGPAGRFLGDAPFRELLSRHAADDPEQLCAAIVKMVSEFQDHELYDDVTVLVLKRVR